MAIEKNGSFFGNKNCNMFVAFPLKLKFPLTILGGRISGRLGIGGQNATCVCTS
jgi:hypothetical protein